MILAHAGSPPSSNTTVLICGHADLAAAMPNRNTLRGLKTEADGQTYFELRPVIALLNYDPTQDSSIARVVFSEGYDFDRWEKNWKNLLLTDTRSRGLATYRRVLAKEKTFANVLDDFTVHHLFANIWSREEPLTLPSRSRITVALLAALGREKELRTHLAGAQNLRISSEELAEILLHVAQYVGWPAGHSALEVLAEEDFLSWPETHPLAGMLVLHPGWGLTEQTRAACQRLNQAGFLALATPFATDAGRSRPKKRRAWAHSSPERPSMMIWTGRSAACAC